MSPDDDPIDDAVWDTAADDLQVRLTRAIRLLRRSDVLLADLLARVLEDEARPWDLDELVAEAIEREKAER